MATVNVTDVPPQQATGAVRHRLHLAGLRLRRGWELHPGVRSDADLSTGERAVDRICDALGSWMVLAAAAVLVGAAIGASVAYDDRAGPAAVVGVVLGGLAVLQLVLVLMTTRRADRIAAELALYDLESIRRAAAGIHEIRDELAELRGDLAQLVARLDTSTPRGGDRGGLRDDRDRGSRPDPALRPRGGSARSRPADRARRAGGGAGPQRRRQDDADEDPRR
jgi:hypothetical protein